MINPAKHDFHAKIHSRDYFDLRVLGSVNDPCSGQHTKYHASQGDDAYFGLLMLLEGKEFLTIGGRPVLLEKDSAVLWDSTKPMKFEMETQIRKVSLLFPQDNLRDYLDNPEQYVGSLISLRQGIGAVLKNYATSLIYHEQGIADRAFLAGQSFELIAACLEQKGDQGLLSKSRRDCYRRIVDYIDSNLGDYDLSPDSIAESFSISKRSLHMLFHDVGNSVSNHIRRKRVEHCKRDLMRHNNETISDIALRWGFSDAAYFSSVFKEHTDLSPREYRKKYLL
jgi:AraC-like DNA-binding protein